MPYQLTLKLPSTPAIADGPILLSIALKNLGNTPAAFPSSEGPSQFRYSIYSPEGDRFLQSASRAERQKAKPWLAQMKELPAAQSEVLPEHSLVYQEDLTPLLAHPLEPGSYIVEASYRFPDGETCVSPRTTLEIAVSKPQAIAQDIAISDGMVVIAEWHRDAAANVLRKRDNGLPPLGHFDELWTSTALEPIRQSAMSRNAAYGIPQRWRWLSWISGGHLLAGVAHDRRWIYPTLPIPLDLDAPSLLPIGYTTADAGALFLIAGKKEGRPSIRLVAIPPGEDAQPVVTTVAFDTLPDAIPEATCVWGPDRAPELILSWTVPISGVTMVLLGRVSAVSGEMPAAPKAVFVTLRSVCAVNCPPSLGPEEQRYGQVLMAPDSVGLPYTHVAFDIASPSSQTARELPFIEREFVPSDVKRWVLPSEPFPNSPVLAVTAEEIWACVGSEWILVADGAIDASSVRLWVFSPARVLCTWFDRDRGYRSELLRG